jgi:hypothetical protein
MITLSKIKTAYYLILDSIFGPLENFRALKSKTILIIPQSGIGDQLLSLSAYSQLAEKMNVHLLVRKAHLGTMEKLLPDSLIKFHIWEESGDSYYKNYSPRKQFSYLAKNIGAAKLSLTDLQLRISRYGRPDVNPVGHIYRICGLNFLSYNHKRYFDAYFRYADGLEQFTPPKTRYALVDHFPGTDREIPQVVFDNIHLKNLEVVHAPKKISFAALRQLVLSAEELHLVNSSMLCFALIVNPDIVSKNIYIFQKEFLLGHELYDLSWNEYLLEPNSKYQPSTIDRGLELQIAKMAARKIRRRISEKIFFSRLPCKF